MVEVFGPLWTTIAQPPASVAPDGRGVVGESGMGVGTSRSYCYD